ncbi:MAG: 4Fe-4S dicluster domain-containing protein [Spirochaetaceae bacterium]|jgi:electron transport protein HydN|nr:4Fe-4S dicluster domain-containing protein [Spirochaetaceae bacterium]
MSVKQSFFVLADTEKCTGCRACELACFAGHQKRKPVTVGNITSPVTPRLYLTRGETLCMPVQCHHCEDAPCLRSCLTGAIKRQDGVVVLDPHRCIGCRNCAMACPFGAVHVFSGEEVTENTESCCTKKLVYKCDLCIDAEEPACAANCPNKALRLVDPAAEITEKRIAAINAMGVFTSEAGAQAAGNEGGN